MDNENKEKEINNEKNEENIKLQVNNSNFSGYFHERDSLTENNIVNEVSTSFLEYSMSVITSRALPDLRDGLKPVNRRILWAMFESGYTPDKPHRKSATTVGYVMGNYHPHGDSSIYEAMVRMAQDFNQRYMLIDGHGNFGNIEGDGAAAMRYTESRLAKLSLELLRDIRKETVDMEDNFDFTKSEPTVLPSRYPNILVNGTMGIAVGMATNIPPHNLGEVIDGCIAYIDNPDIDSRGLMAYIKGPDFPTGGVILGNKGITKAYETGRGSITIRSKATIEEKNGKNYIIIDEVPYGVNTLDLKNKVAELVHTKVIDGISDYHTDLKDGVKITITLKKDANPQIVLNNLYKHTNFQVNYGIILLMLDNGIPRMLCLKDIISKYIDFQKEVIIRRTKFDLKKAEAKVHILEGYKIALDNLDDFINIIRNSRTDIIAKEQLISKYGLSEAQADAILELRLRRLTGLEREKIENELQELLEKIKYYNEVLASEQKVLDIIKEELLEIKDKYGDERRTNIDMTAIDFIEDESLIPVDNIVITLTNKGYIKRMLQSTYKTQNRGGVGIKGMTTNEEDFVENLISMTTHDYLMFFTNKGKVYRVKGYEIPEFSRQSKGLPIINLLPLEKEENIKAMLKVSNNEEKGNIIFCTKNGIVKRTALEEFENIRKTGKLAITLKEGDELLSVDKTNGTNEIIIASSNGRMIRFQENEIRIMGRTASGVKGIDLGGGMCVGLEISSSNDQILVVTENGYGKRTNIEEYRMTHRGSKGVKALNITEKNGNIVAFKLVNGEEDLMIITNSGMIIRLSVDQISTTGRVAQGVRLINLKENQQVSNIAIIEKESEEQEIDEESNNQNIKDA
ncbi:MAG: DNA gyrase subunit A [Bacilli bacterium]|nr:DNA gyrase subunit A [Bacilli bacterium]